MFLLTKFQKHFISTTVPNLKKFDLEPLKINKAFDLRKMIKIKAKREMTLLEISSALNRPIEHVYECIERIGLDKQGVRMRKNFLITNYSFIQDIFKLSGVRVTFENNTNREGRDELEEAKYLKENDEYADKRPKYEKLVQRSPIVTIMGHVDHGKTTLLDALRNTNVVATEFGGITQHIGAFNCSLMSSSEQQEKTITFLDTPGHAAFIQMRARGARLTDIIVLVVAADDGVMEQTIESIRLAKESKCEIIIAINKIDKSTETQIRKLKQDLLKYDLQTEDIGGDIQCVHISALKRQNIEVLKEKIWALAEIMELKGDPTPGLVEGYIIESYQDANRGKLATAVLKRGTLMKNSYLVSGTTYCKVKQMLDDKLLPMSEASLSNAVLIMGWKDLPEAGWDILEVISEKRAKEVVQIRLRKKELEKIKEDLMEIERKNHEHELVYQKGLIAKRIAGYRYTKRRALERNPEKPVLDNAKNHILSVIIKTDVNGTLDAILSLLEKYDCDKVKLEVVHFDVGPVIRSDIELAEMFGSIIYCFNIPHSPTSAGDDSNSKNYQIKHFNIIYRLFDDIKLELGKIAPLVEQEEILGEAEFTKVFEINDKKESVYIGGGRCLDGLIDSRKYFRIIRDGKVLFEKEKSKTLKHMKTVVQSIKKGSEFGLGFENLMIKPEIGDRIVCYDIRMVNEKISWDIGF